MSVIATGLARIHVTCYSGAIAVFHPDDPDHYKKLEDFHVQHAVHSLAIDHTAYTLRNRNKTGNRSRAWLSMTP